MSILFQDIISVENLLAAWEEFTKGKSAKADVQKFKRGLIDNLLDLHYDLADFRYQHGSYQAFSITDPKPRRIHKASVRDRVLHHAVHRVLYPYFDRLFISDSFSCRNGKGTHGALARFQAFSRRVSRNSTCPAWVLQCDVKKFFDSIDQEVLLQILARYIADGDALWLLGQVIVSFSTQPGKGLPLGNLTSQIFVNIYMNEFDQWVKHRWRVRYYIRYADDFVLFSRERAWLEAVIPAIEVFLQEHLKLLLHPDKVFIKTLASGADFLGWVHFPNHRILRTTTAQRMKRRIEQNPRLPTLRSYQGLLRHGDARLLEQEIVNQYWLWSQLES